MISKCAVVGANGFLGKTLTQKLSERGFDVTAIYNTSFSNIDAEINKMKISDFLNTENQYDYIILSIGSYQCSHKELIEINEIIHKIQNQNSDAKIIFISSTNVYGIHEDAISTNTSYNNPTLYPLSKLAGEFLVTSHKKYAILRLTYLYGKGLNNKSFLPNMIEKSQVENEIVLFGDGSRKQDYLHVNDAAELCMKAMEKDINGTFLGASGMSFSNYEIAKIVSENHNSKINFTGSESGSSFFFDIEDTKEKLNWKPQIDIKTGIREML